MGRSFFLYSRVVLSLVIAVVAAQVEIDQLMRTAGDERAPRVMALCRPGSAWWAANESNANALASCEAALRAFATEAHEAAQRDRDRARYLEAKRRYRVYLDAFGPGPHLSDEAFNVTFYLAEVLWSLESWQEAIAQYEAVARFQLPDRDSARLAAHPRYRELADYDLVLAWGKLVARERGRPGSRASGDDQKEGPPIGARRTKRSSFSPLTTTCCATTTPRAPRSRTKPRWSLPSVGTRPKPWLGCRRSCAGGRVNALRAKPLR